MSITAQTKLCLMIGDPVQQSFSPELHNLAYASIHVQDKFVYLATTVKPQHLDLVVRASRALHLAGMTCIAPHNQQVIHNLDRIEEVARKIGSVDTIVNHNGELAGYNTDWLGAAIAIQNAMITRQPEYTIEGKKIAIFGTGDLARSIGLGLSSKGAHIIIVDTDEAAVNTLALEIGCSHCTPSQTDVIFNANILINTTRLGAAPLENDIPIHPSVIGRHHVVFDTIIFPIETTLLKEAKKRGAVTIQGLDRILFRETSQFELLTSLPAPIENMRKQLLQYLDM